MTPQDKDRCTLPEPCPQAEGDSQPDQGAGARIYGKETCPHTKRARAALPRARFIDVESDPAALAEMLGLTGGVRRIPVIARKEGVAIGYKRGA
jgi:glutaredoxin 3